MPTKDPADAIAAALARVRSRGGPRPPWADGEHPHGGPHHPHHAGGHPFERHGGPFGGGFPGGPARFGGPAKFRLLDVLAAADEPLTVGQVADGIGVDQPRASRLVQQAVAGGWAQRQADPDDARRTRIALTEQGRDLVGRFRGERRDAVRAALEGFTPGERTELARLLQKFADAWPSR